MTKDVERLHLLRNPYGSSEQDVREARLWAADLIERLQAELTALQVQSDEYRDAVIRANREVVKAQSALTAERERAERNEKRIAELEGATRELLPYVESEYIGARGKDYSSGAIGRARAAMVKP